MSRSDHHLGPSAGRNPSAIRVGLVVGAGGPTGGPFIHAALGELAQHTGWTAAAATTVVGTSAGAFVAASIDPIALTTTNAQLEALASLDNGTSYSAGRRHAIVAAVRLGVGSLLARAAPRSRPVADYRVPPSPYHEGASVVTVARRNGRRAIHQLNTVANAETVVRASAAIPGANGPIDIGGELHVDGAVYSAANADVVDIAAHDAIVIIAPMVAASGGSIVTRSHRAQLRTQIEPWICTGKPTVVVIPNEAEHADRRNRETFERAGVLAVQRLLANRDL